jgi:hypothetical protein
MGRPKHHDADGAEPGAAQGRRAKIASVDRGAELNTADFMIAPRLALILYRSETHPLLEGRPALELVDRLLPEPAHERPKAPA